MDDLGNILLLIGIWAVLLIGSCCMTFETVKSIYIDEIHRLTDENRELRMRSRN